MIGKTIIGSNPVFHRAMVILLITPFFLLIDGYATRAISDDGEENLVNYAFATWIGSGVYRVGDRRMAIFRAPLRYTVSKAEETKPGLKLLLPITLAYYDYNNSEVDFGAGAFVPGLEVTFRVNEYWSLKPFGQFGVGKDTAGGDTVFIYGGGIGSLVSITYHKFVFGIGNSLILADERDEDGDIGSNFTMVEAGLDIKHPLGVSFRNREMDGSVFL